MHDALRAKFICRASVVGVTHVKSQHQSLAQFDALTCQVFDRPGTGQSQAIGIVKVMEVDINQWFGHRHTPTVSCND
jgi:hypothetical protein